MPCVTGKPEVIQHGAADAGEASILNDKLVSAAALKLASLPTLTFILQGHTADLSLKVAPSDCWQVNTEKVGTAMLAITQGDPGLAILGLPLMNGHFTICDGEADNGRGVIKFATRAG